MSKGLIISVVISLMVIGLFILSCYLMTTVDPDKAAEATKEGGKEKSYRRWEDEYEQEDSRPLSSFYDRNKRVKSLAESFYDTTNPPTTSTLVPASAFLNGTNVTIVVVHNLTNVASIYLVNNLTNVTDFAVVKHLNTSEDLENTLKTIHSTTVVNNLDSVEDSKKMPNTSHSAAFRRSIDVPENAEDHNNNQNGLVFKILDEDGMPTIEIKILHHPYRTRDSWNSRSDDVNMDLGTDIMTLMENRTLDAKDTNSIETDDPKFNNNKSDDVSNSSIMTESNLPIEETQREEMPFNVATPVRNITDYVRKLVSQLKN